MGVEVMLLRSMFFLFVLVQVGFTGGYQLTKRDIEEARNKLKVYGFTECLYQQFKDRVDVNKDVILSDIMVTNSSYFFTGTGMHAQIQNENLDIVYDPYKKTEEYIQKVYPTIKGISRRTGKPVVMINCFKIYNSKEFNDFIKEQDKYIQTPAW
jgi:hypothetical protein